MRISLESHDGQYIVVPEEHPGVKDSSEEVAASDDTASNRSRHACIVESPEPCRIIIISQGTI